MNALIQNQKELGLLISPSWLSTLIAVVIGLIVSVGVIVAFNFNNSSVQQQIIAWESSQPQKPLTQPDQILPENNKPTLQGSWALVVVWGLVGLVAYASVMSLVSTLGQLKLLKDSLDYVHADRQSIIKSAAEHIALRLVSTISLIVLFEIFIKRVLPYAITVAHASASDLLSFSGVGDALLAFAVVAVSLHLQTILLRLSFARPRLLTK